MVYRCPSCNQPDTRPGVRFQTEKVCGPCQNYDTEINKEEKEKRFLRVLKELDPEENFRTPESTLLGVSGGKDSLRQALWLRERFGIEPLLVCLTYPSEQVSDVGLANMSNLIKQGFSMVNISLPVKTWKNFMRQGFLKYCNYMKSTELALISSVPRYAIENGYRIIFWGENPGQLNDDRGSLSDKDWDGNNLRHLNTLQGGDLNWIDADDVPKNGLDGYKFPKDEALRENDIQIIFMSPFMEKWGLLENAYHSSMYGLEHRQADASTTGDLYRVSSLDEDWVAINQMIKFYKFGFGRASDYMTQEVRYGKIDLGLAKTITEYYDGLCSDELIARFCDFIDIKVSAFWETVNSHTNRELFETFPNKRPKKLFK